MKNLFFLTSIIVCSAFRNLTACQRVVTYDDSVRNYYLKDKLNNICVAWLVLKDGKLQEPIMDLPETRGYGIMNDKTPIPNNAEYGIFTTFPLEKTQQVACLLTDDGELKHEGVVSDSVRSKILLEMLSVTTSQSYQARAQEFKNNNPKVKWDSTERIKQELLTIHKMANVTKNKRLKMCVSIQNSSGRDVLIITEK